jgi:hypothetical protein
LLIFSHLIDRYIETRTKIIMKISTSHHRKREIVGGARRRN